MSAATSRSFVLIILIILGLNMPYTQSILNPQKTKDILEKPVESSQLNQFLYQSLDRNDLDENELIHYQLIKAEKLYEEKKYLEALLHLKELLNSISGKTSPEYLEIFILMGRIHSQLHQTDSSIISFKKAIKIAQTLNEKIQIDKLISLYEKIADRYRWVSDYLEALGYYNQILAVIEKEGNDNFTEKKISAHCGIGKCYRYLSKKEKSLEHFHLALNFIQKLPKSEQKTHLIKVHEGLGLTFNYFDDYESAIDHFKSSISYSIQEHGYYSGNTALLIDVLGNSYYFLKDYQNAINHFQEALRILKGKNAPKRPNFFSNRYSKIGACFTNLELFEKANFYLNKSIEELNFDSGREYPFETLNTKRSHLLITLYFKAKNHQKAYEAGWGKSQLHEASYWFDLCIELIEYINSTFTEPGSKQYLLERFYYIFEAAINCKYHLYQESDSLLYLEQAFGYAERSKALLLKEAMQMAGAVLASAIPESLQEEENRLKKAIIERENRRYELQQGGDSGPEVHELNSEIFNLKQAYHQVMDSIRRQHPKEHRLRYPAAPLTPREIQEGLLAPGQALLQYFLGDDHLFLFVIRQGDVSIVKKPKEKGLAEAVLGLRESIYGWSQSQEDSLAEQYAAYGYQLYQSLVQPVAHLLPERLIIVPDGILEYVPFEALLREAAGPPFRNFSSYPYLIRDFQISYAHSARLLQEMKTAAYAARRRWVLAFAPSFTDLPGQDTSLASRRRNLGRLTGNVKEVQAIKRLLRTRVYKGTDATRERFLADAPYYSIIHLATHAKANDEEGEYSYLAFAEVPDTLQNELLYAKDLYSLRLQADLVVISACESGVGELRRGEGVISIARGFSYAGAKSLATTLWRVSDRESAALMASFYQQLKDGRPKDEALRAAKLQFISQPGAMYAHPFFWAAFTLTGDMAPIAVSGQIFPAWVYALLIGLFVFLSLRFAKRKPS